MEELIDFAKQLLAKHDLSIVLLLLILLLWLYGRFDPVWKALNRIWVWASSHFRYLPHGKCDTVEKIDALINRNLQVMVYKYDACRAYVFEYQGYDDRIRPLPWTHCSNTYEYCNPGRGVQPSQSILQSLPLAAIKYWTRQLGTEGQICLHDIAALKEDDMESHKILEGQQISSVYCASFYDLHGKPLGFVGVDYCCGHPSRVQSDADMQSLAMDGVRIAALIMLKYNGTKEQLRGIL